MARTYFDPVTETVVSTDFEADAAAIVAESGWSVVMEDESELRGFQTVRVAKEKLLETLRRNHETHAKEFTDALAGWRTEIVARLEANLRKAKDGGDIVSRVDDLPMPEDHSTAYVRAIRMLEFSLDDEFELSNQEFNQFVLDEWGWTAGFKRMSAVYTSNVAAKR